MGVRDSERLADLVAALAEFARRLGLSDGDRAALQAELDALRLGMLWQGDPRQVEASLRSLRGLLAPAGDNRLARAAVQEIDALLGE